MEIKDKTVIITGVASGLEVAFAESLNGMGAKIFILDMNKNKGEALFKVFDAAPSLWVFSKHH